jgi:hypothetical protein
MPNANVIGLRFGSDYAIALGATIATADEKIHQYPVKTLW